MEIKQLSPDDNQETFDEIARLFKDMYAFMAEKGLHISLATNGENLWLNSIKKTLNKLNVIYYAVIDNQIVGFSAGNIRLMPAFLGSKKIGFISHVYVTPETREKGTGINLASSLEAWFHNQHVDGIELEVLHLNEGAVKFWQKMGYTHDLLKMIKYDKV